MTTKLDFPQVIKEVYDEPNKRLRVDASISGDIIIDEINISQTTDSIRIGDGINLITATVNGPKTGLDVNVINDLEISINASTDSIAIGDGVNNLVIESDGSINVNTDNLNFATDSVNVTGSDITISNQVNIRELDFGTDSIDVTGSNVTVQSTDLDIRNLDNNIDNVAIGNGFNIVQVNSNSELLVKDTDLNASINSGIILSGTDDGTLTGVKYPLVYNLRQQILAAEDREQDIFYADFGTKNQRITQIDYSSAKIGAYIARKTITYTLIGTRYRRDSIDWAII